MIKGILFNRLGVRNIGLALNLASIALLFILYKSIDDAPFMSRVDLPEAKSAGDHLNGAGGASVLVRSAGAGMVFRTKARLEKGQTAAIVKLSDVSGQSSARIACTGSAFRTVRAVYPISPAYDTTITADLPQVNHAADATCTLLIDSGASLKIRSFEIIQYSRFRNVVKGGLSLLLLTTIILAISLNTKRLSRFIGGLATVLKSVKYSHVIVSVAILGVSSVLICRNLAQPLGLNFGDEAVYLLLSRYSGGPPPSAINAFLGTVSPNYLYLHLYGLLRYFDSNMLATARIVNGVLCAVAIIPLYLVFARFTRFGVALLLACAIVLGPLGTYTALFLPESMYSLVFWLVILAVTTFVESFSLQSASLAGLLAGALILIKPHALTPMLLLFLALACLAFVRAMQKAFPSGGAGAVLFAVSAYASYIVIKILLGEGRSSVLGGNYSGLVTRTVNAGNFLAVLHVLGGHWSWIVSIYALPLVAMLMAVTICRKANSSGSEVRAGMFLCVAGLLIIGVLVITTSMFTVAIGGSDITNPINRMDSRYYEFALPLLIAGCLASRKRVEIFSRMYRGTLATIFLAAAGAFVLLARDSSGFVAGYSDSPDFEWFMTSASAVHWLVPSLAAVTLLMAALRPSWGFNSFIVFFCGCCLASGYSVSKDILRPAPFLRAQEEAIAARNVVPDDLRGQGLVVFRDWGVNVWATLLHLRGTEEALATDRYANIDWSKETRDRRWVLALGDVPVPSLGRLVLQGETTRLYILPPNSEPQARIEALAQKVAPATGSFFIDDVGSSTSKPSGRRLMLGHDDDFIVRGWAVDQRNGGAASAVFVGIDGRLYRAEYGLRRPDVAVAWRQPAYEYSGFSASIPATVLAGGEHKAYLRVVSTDWTQYFDVGLPDIVVAGQGSGADSNRDVNPSSTKFFLDRFGPVAEPFGKHEIGVKRGEAIEVVGWAVDEPRKTTADGVEIVIDGKRYTAVYALDRQDVATALKVPAYRYSGFDVSIPASDLRVGNHAVTIRILSSDHKSMYLSQELQFNVR